MKWRQLIPEDNPKSDTSNESRTQKAGARPLPLAPIRLAPAKLPASALKI